MHFDPTQLLDIQIDALFVSDNHGRLRYIREPGYDEAELDPAPRFFMGRTPYANTWRFRHDVPDAAVHAIEQLCRQEPLATNLADPPQQAEAIRAVLQAYAPITDEWRGPAYWIPESVTATTNVVLISEMNAHLLAAYFPWKITSRSSFKTGPMVAAVVDNKAVSICYCARITSIAAEAGVETTDEYRGDGHGSSAVSGWAVAIRQRGLIPLYSTAWSNLASQGVARKLGMLLYADNWSIT